MKKQIAVIGAGIAGLEAGNILDSMGFSVTVIEKSDLLGGHVNQWYQLFPDRKAGSDIVAGLTQEWNPEIPIHYNKEVVSIQPFSGKFIISATDGWVINSDAVLITTGFELFDARRKEEYGYGIYDHVITSRDLEELFITPGGITHRLGKSPSRVGFVHCVGSRDEKVGNIYCSKVCCVTAVKQAIEIREMFPESEVFCFYMDLRMFGRHYEELYKEAQEIHSIQFIRGRLSEAAENKSGAIVLKVEDTLLGKPLKLSVDLLVLMSGMVASPSTESLIGSLGLEKESDRFFRPMDPHNSTNLSQVEGVFFAGACTGPKTITDTLTDARSAALAVKEYLSK